VKLTDCELLPHFRRGDQALDHDRGDRFTRAIPSAAGYPRQSTLRRVGDRLRP
jgi:hypothetical protein